VSERTIRRGPSAATFDDLWRAHRRRMLQLALRMLSDLGDAEDVVQEAFARLARADLATIDDPEGWLVVVTGRLCLDRLRTRQRHPTDPLDAAIEPAAELDPSDHVALVDTVTLSMHVVLERLSPAERTAFVLHDMFQLPFEDVAAIVGRSPAACRQLASRARRTIKRSPGRFAVDAAAPREVSERFIQACVDGNLDALVAVLDPAVDGHGDVVAGDVAGADVVAPQILRYLGPPASPTLLHVPLGDRAGVVAVRGRQVLALVVLSIENDRVTHIEAFAGPGPRAAVGRALGLI
jgi:RNA polymerase sigma-70 factor, ECF subfamily